MMPLIQANVVSLNINSVFQDISTFLNNASKASNTSKAYKKDIEDFFRINLGKNLNELTVQDLDIKKKDVERYQSFLLDHGYKSATVNRKTDSVRSLFKYFQENKYRYKDADGEWVEITPYPFNVGKVEKHDSEGSGILTHEEMTAYIETAKTLANGEEKSLCFELAAVTSFRLTAVVSLKLSDFRLEGDTWVVKTIDKDIVNEKAVRTDLYERLVANSKDGKIFNMSGRTMERAFEQITKILGLDPERNLSFHSVKKYGIGEVYNITDGDFMATAQQGNHSSFETTKKYYMELQKDYSTMPCLMIGQDVDVSPLEELSKEELLQLIQDGGRGVQFRLLNKLKKKNGNN